MTTSAETLEARLRASHKALDDLLMLIWRDERYAGARAGDMALTALSLNRICCEELELPLTETLAVRINEGLVELLNPFSKARWLKMAPDPE
jgi:hypothetical protein